MTRAAVRTRAAAWPAALALALTMGAVPPVEGHAQAPPIDATAQPPLPPDIDPASRYRLPLPRREDMTNDQDRQIFDDLTKDRKPVLWLYSPKLAKAMEDAHHYVRFETGLDARLTTIAVLTTARALNSQVEWTEWEEQARPGRPSAVEPAIIDLIKYCRPVVGLGPKETLIITYGRELFGPGQAVSSRTFSQAVALLGRRGALDLTDLMALYQATATELKAYDGHLHAGEKPLLPPLRETPDCAGA